MGYVKSKQSDWFRDSTAKLTPLPERRNKLWLNTGKERDRHKFAAAQSAARKAIRLAKEKWFVHKAEKAERGRHSSKVLWRCIRDIQRGRRGLAPVRSSVKKEMCVLVLKNSRRDGEDTFVIS